MLTQPDATSAPVLDLLFELARTSATTVTAERITYHDGSHGLVAVRRLNLPAPDLAREAFFRGARIAALLDHPNLVRLIAVGTEDKPAITMELVLGESLACLIDAARPRNEHPLAPSLAAAVLAEVCDALHELHELADPETGEPMLLVHNGVSPRSILLGYDGMARLGGFDHAQVEGDDLTPYLAPEVIAGGKADRRSDVFSIGALLFELLAGRRMGSDDSGVELPGELGSIYAELTALDPKDRPATAQEVAVRLREFGALTASEGGMLLAARMAQMFPGKREDLVDQLRTGVDPPHTYWGQDKPRSSPRKVPFITLVLITLMLTWLANAAFRQKARLTRPAERPASSAPER